MTTTPDPLPPGEHQADPVRDLTTLEHIELENLRLAVLNEQERRERVDRAPIEVAALARDAIAAGVTPGDLRAATLTEQERRTRIADGPTRLADDARALIASGADPGALREAIEDALTEQP